MREIKEFPAWRTSGFLGFTLLPFALACHPVGGGHPGLGEPLPL